MTTKTWSRNMGQLAIDPDETGLVAGYNMVPRSDGTIEDLSGNGNHGTINGPGFEYSEIGPSMRFDGVGDKITTTYTGAPVAFTLSGWYNLKSAGQGNFGRVFSKGVSVFEVFPINSPTNLNLRYENGSGAQDITLVNGYVQNLCFHFAVTYASGSIKVYLNRTLIKTIVDSIVLDSSALVIGNTADGIRASEGNFSNFKFYERALTAAEIQAEYLAGAKAVNWKSDYGVSESTAAESAPGELSNSPARVISGSHKISSDTIDGCTAKVIECVTAGVVAIPTAYFHGDDTQAAHGTFELLVNKALDANALTVGVIGNQATAPATAGYNGYAISIAADESLSLLEFTNGVPSTLLSTAAGFVSIATWYKLKLTISANGKFTLYMDAALVDVTGGSGTNPVTDTSFTTSKYVVLDSDAGDKTSWSAKNGSCAIVKYEGIV